MAGNGNCSGDDPGARVKEARRLSQIRLRLGDVLHRRGWGYGVAGAEELLVLHGGEIIDRIVIWEQDCD